MTCIFSFAPFSVARLLSLGALIILGLIAPSAQAQPRSGIAALLAVESPQAESAQVLDPSFPRALEREGDVQGALLEWKRIAYNSRFKSDAEEAAFQTARLTYRLQRPKEALALFAKFGEEYPKSKYIPEALFYMSRSADSLHPHAGDAYRNRLLALFPDDAWHEKAHYLYVWDLAQSGAESFPDTALSASTRAQELSDRLADYPTSATQSTWLATGLALLPGAGHLYLGDWRSALVAALFNLIFLAAFFYSCRYRLWAYAAFFGMIATIFYSGSVFSAHNLSLRNQLEARLDAMATWETLQPQLEILADKKEPQAALYPTLHPITPSDVPLWAYRHSLGRVDGSRANGFPVNSLYARQALEQHGFVRGTWLTVDRLIRDWREAAHPRATLFADGRWRYDDSLARNTFTPNPIRL